MPIRPHRRLSGRGLPREVKNSQAENGLPLAGSHPISSRILIRTGSPEGHKISPKESQSVLQTSAMEKPAPQWKLLKLSPQSRPITVMQNRCRRVGAWPLRTLFSSRSGEAGSD